MKYFFRDLDNESNLENDKTFHASGVAELYNKIGEASLSGKDVSVTFLHPFTGQVYYAWRSFDEIELFEAHDFEFENMSKVFEVVRNGS